MNEIYPAIVFLWMAAGICAILLWRKFKLAHVGMAMVLANFTWMARNPQPLPMLTSVAAASEGGFVAAAVDTYHVPGCPLAGQSVTYVSREAAESENRRPCSCVSRIAASRAFPSGTQTQDQ